MCFSVPAFAQEDGSSDNQLANALNAFSFAAGNLAGTAGNQAATMAAISEQLAEYEDQLITMGVKPSKCTSECKNNCVGHQKYCSKLRCTRTNPQSPCGPCSADASQKSCVSTNGTCVIPGDIACRDYIKCSTVCKARNSLNRAKGMSWQSILALMGIAASTLATGLGEDKRSCEDKCGRETDARLKQRCMESNTNEYGESCAYTLPAGKCDDTDEILKPDPTNNNLRICDDKSWTGGCSLYIEQCHCNVRAEQTKQNYTYDIEKSECVLKRDGGPSDNNSFSGGDDPNTLAPAGSDDKVDEKTAAKPTGSGLAGSAGAGSGGAAGTAGAGKNAKAQSNKKDAKLTGANAGSFKDPNYTGYVGESGGTQGTASADKKPTDIDSSKAKDTLFEQISEKYTGYKDAGRFLSADFKEPTKKTTDKKGAATRIKKKG